MVQQVNITLQARPRGFHLITREVQKVINELSIQSGIAHVFIQHTSASLCINENADPTVRQDLESFMNQLAPENSPYFLHNYEGPDDMPAHIKSCLLGSSVSVPLKSGQLQLGTWQGIYLCEHRNHGGRRHLMITLIGE